MSEFDIEVVTGASFDLEVSVNGVFEGNFSSAPADFTFEVSSVGPAGPSGILTAEYPLVYDAGTSDISIASGYFALQSSLANYLTISAAQSTYAPIISPSFSGIPQAPTPAQGIATTQIATTAFVDSWFAPKASPTFTGTVTVPTPTAGDNTQKAASTAFVNTALSTSLASYITSAQAAATYYPLTNPDGFITSSALSPYLLSSTAASTYQTQAGMSAYLTSATAASTYYLQTNPAGYITTAALSGYATEAWVGLQDYATNTALTNGLALKANVSHTHDASAIVSGVIDLARIPIIPSQIQVISTQSSIANLTPAEQAQITGAGVLVTTTDGNRWVYSGTGSKTSESSYVRLADVTPDWTEITNKPAFGTMSLEATTDWLSKAENLSGLSNLSTARTNLGLGTMAVETATNYLTKAGNLSGLANTATARTNLGLGSIATASASTYYLATNPSGYITNAALSGYATQSWVTSQGYLTAPYNPFNQSLNTGDSAQFTALSLTSTGITFPDATVQTTAAVGLPPPFDTSTPWLLFWDNNTSSWKETAANNSTAFDDGNHRVDFGNLGNGASEVKVSSGGVATSVLSFGVKFPTLNTQTAAVISPSHNDNFIVVWHNTDFYTTRAYERGVFFNSADGAHRAEFVGGVTGEYAIKVSSDSGSSWTKLVGAGIYFPDGTLQTTASSGGGIDPPSDPSKPWLLSWDTSNSIWVETGSRDGVIYVSGDGLQIDFGYKNDRTALRVGHASSDVWTEVTPQGIYFPDSTLQTTAWTGSYNPFDQSLNTTDNVVFNYVSAPTVSGFLAADDYSTLTGGTLTMYGAGGLVGTIISSSSITFADGTVQTTAATNFDPTGYATETWVQSQGYLTAPYNSFNQSLNTTDEVAFRKTTLTDGAVGTIVIDPYWTGSGITHTVGGYIAGMSGLNGFSHTDGTNTISIKAGTGITFADASIQTTAYTGPTNPFNQSLNTTDNVNFNSVASADSTQGSYFNKNTVSVLDFTLGGYPVGVEISVTGGVNISKAGLGITFPDATVQTTAAQVFDQSLNTTDNVGFNYVSAPTVSGFIAADDYSTLTGGTLTLYGAGSVAGTTITPSGITFADATVQTTAFPPAGGTTAQYIDGTGALQTFPSGTAATKLETTVYNNSGATIPQFSVVYINGGHGNDPTIALSQANDEATSRGTFGFTTTAIADQSLGTVIQVGLLEGVNTHGIPDGTLLFLSPTVAGGWTTTQPYSPNHYVALGTVTREHPTQGAIQVRILNSNELSELSDVQVQSANNADGIYLDTSDGIWKSRGLSYVLGSGNETLGGLIKDGLVNSNAPSSTNAFATLGDVESSVNAYAASVTPLLPTSDEKAALANANTPSLSNPFLTLTGLPSASESTQGIVELATKAQVETPTSTTLATSPARTKDLARRFLLKRGIYQPQGGSTTQVTGTGASYSQIISYSNVTPPSAGIAGFARGNGIVNTSDPTHLSANGAWLNFSKEEGFGQAVYLSNASSFAGIRTMMIIGEANSPAAGVALGNPTNKRIGMSHTVGGNILLMVHDGTTLRFIDSGATPPTSGTRKYYIEVVWDGTGYAEMYVKDNLGNEFSCSTVNAPVGSPQSLVHSGYTLQVSSSTTHTANWNLSPSHPSFYFA